MIIALAQGGPDRAEEFIEIAKQRKAKAICFPELMGDYTLDMEQLYERAKDTEKKLKELSEDILIVCGMPENDRYVKGVIYDSGFAVENGEVIGRYRKTHVHPSECSAFRAGNSLEVFDSEIGKIAIAICFDHAFPEIFRIYALKGAEIIFILSAVPEGYEHLLELRTRARAQDNQLFTVGCNACNSNFCGRSLIADPKGNIVAQAGRGEELLFADIDLSSIEKERISEPVFRCRRDDLYSRELKKCLEQ
ncbi:MAG: carbon-nitrogen hydrolase family protein [Candidatus Thermoplasmatota archaeon]|nr:carbon-nitrogen hydrolase family protein [Candidatus Thermoplasmatota archaeon]